MEARGWIAVPPLQPEPRKKQGGGRTSQLPSGHCPRPSPPASSTAATASGAGWPPSESPPAADPALRAALQGALQLIEVVVVVPRHQRDELPDGHAALHRVDRAAVPGLDREPTQEAERLLPTPPERAQCMLGVRAQGLALVGPPVGVDREELGLVHSQDRAEAAHERLLRVAQVAEHLRGGPVLRVRST